MSAPAVAVFALISTPASSATPTAATTPQVLFDDFDYGGFNQSFELWHHGWKV